MHTSAEACTNASFAADFYLTVKVALHDKNADSEEDRDGLECDLGQGLVVLSKRDHSPTGMHSNYRLQMSARCKSGNCVTWGQRVMVSSLNSEG